ncbi:hypothetical protein JCM9279_005738 [Rhodotorula babjevae]
MERIRTLLRLAPPAPATTDLHGKEGGAQLATTAQEAADPLSSRRAPFCLRQRSSTWFIAFAVGWGVLVDLSSYSLVVPVVPFRLQALGYDDIGGKTGWLVAAYAAGLIVSSPVAGWIGAKYKNRQIPLTLGLLFMAGAVILFMESESFALMVVARVLQGFSGTVLWTIGLALVTDSVPEERLGSVLGYVMVGFSCGQAIGPPVGGVLYERLGYRAPFIFSIVLVAIDLALRIVMIEKHQALRWIRAGHDIPNFEAPGYLVAGGSEATLAELDTSVPLGGEAAPRDKYAQEHADEVARSEAKHSRLPPHVLGLLHMLKDPRALTSFGVTLLNGTIAGGLQDTALTLWVEQEYGLNSLGAGLVFLGVVVPTFFFSPLAGWISDKHGTKWLVFGGLLLSLPAYLLLIIRGPLPLFIFFLAILGVSISFFITPITLELSIVAADTPAISTAHVFGAFNLAFSVGALIGPIIAGQILSAVGTTRGWLALTIISAGLTAIAAPPVLLFIGGRLDWRALRARGGKRSSAEEEKGEKERDVQQDGAGFLDTPLGFWFTTSLDADGVHECESWNKVEQEETAWARE